MIDPAELEWQSSRGSGDDEECVEVAVLPDGGRALRDSKDKGKGPVLWFTAAEWDAFVKGAKAGEFDDLT